ncbi:MAG: aldose epimerase family protein [Armatimonadota bacterium]
MRAIDKYELSDGTSCEISPDWGCNLFSWTVDGKELMYCPDDYPEAAWKITGGGNPILFPSVGRTWDFSTGEPVQGIYRIHPSDKTWFMPSHGIIYNCKFEKIDETREPDRISVAYELQISEKVKADNYPFDIGLVQRFTLTHDAIELEATITNNDDSPAPAAFGYHPYFRISNSQREGVEVRLPVTKFLKTTEDTVLLTGESEDADGMIDLQPDLYYDHTFTGATGTRMSLIDSEAGHTIHVDYDKKFELFLVYSPDGSDFVCIEPWTRGLGAYMHLLEPEWQSGERIPVLQSGETVSYKATFSVSRSCTEH